MNTLTQIIHILVTDILWKIDQQIKLMRHIGDTWKRKHLTFQIATVNSN